MANDYTLNGQSLRAMGFVPGHASGSNIALSGAWNMPARLGTCFHEWPDLNAVEAYVGAEDIVFGGREISLTGTVVGDGLMDVGTRIQELRNWLSSQPAEVTLAGKWGQWSIQMRKSGAISVKARRFGQVTITFYEPRPTVTKTAPQHWQLAEGCNGVFRDDSAMWDNTDVTEGDLCSWRSFGVVVSDVSGIDELTARREQNVTQSLRGQRFVRGGMTARTVTINGTVIGRDMTEFQAHINSLQWLLGSSGLRRFMLHGQTITCFAKDGFTVTEVQVRDKVRAKITIKVQEAYV